MEQLKIISEEFDKIENIEGYINYIDHKHIVIDGSFSVTQLHRIAECMSKIQIRIDGDNDE